MIHGGFFYTRFFFQRGKLSLYRKGQIHDFSYDQVSLIEVKKGSDLKRPNLSIGFGIMLMLLCGKILSSAGFDFGDFFGGGVILRILAVLFFVGGLGAHSIYSGLPIHPIIEIHFVDSKERFLISAIIKKGAYKQFAEFLQTEFETKCKLDIDPFTKQSNR